jgi:alginate O-acetyltransferase complex protein AlgI
MLFNSIDFAIFLPIVFLLYWFVTAKDLKIQNFFILIVSYVFYGWWDWKFLSLILFSTLVDYSIGLGLQREEVPIKRKILLWLSILINLGFLGFFKYYNFFLENFIAAFSFLGMEFSPSSLNIILPVGISFYTFQTLSYSIDVYKKRLEPTKDFIAFAAFVSFFPQLVAGPIERASNLLPQFFEKRTLTAPQISDGLRQILWGFFKKIVIADTCGIIVDSIFLNPESHNSSTLILAAIFFSFQIYGDFSGYSDIAIGTAKLFGFQIMTNFKVPYFSRNIAEFWRRWHISLSSWFQDYLYIPLGGSRGTKSKTIRNIFIIFLVSGFWHGANWTFIFWGGINAFLFLPSLLFGKNRKYLGTVAEETVLPSLKELYQMSLTFGFTTIAWIFFRADSVIEGFDYLHLIGKHNFEFPIFKGQAVIVPLIGVLLIIEWINRRQLHQLDVERFSSIIRHSIYILLLGLIFFFAQYNRASFIYFQF